MTTAALHAACTALSVALLHQGLMHASHAQASKSIYQPTASPAHAQARRDAAHQASPPTLHRPTLAGEFCILPEPGAPGGQRLVIDNNSGTYAPAKEYLPRMAELFTTNFPGMVVETLDAHDPHLKSYHQLCPSRTM